MKKYLFTNELLQAVVLSSIRSCDKLIFFEDDLLVL